MTQGPASPRRILVLSGGLIHLVHQLAVLRSSGDLQVLPGSDRDPQRAPGLPATSLRAGLQTDRGDPRLLRGSGDAAPALIAVLITGVLTRNPHALTALHETIEPWFARLRQASDGQLAGLQLVRQPEALPPVPWHLVCLNNQWQANQREWMERLAIPELLVCGDGLGLYYRCARELRALLPSLLGLPIREPGRLVRYGLSGLQPRWHRPPLPPLPAPLLERRRLFALLVESLHPQGAAELAACLGSWEPDRPLWLCSVPNLAHQFPCGRIAPAVLRHWCRRLERRHGFRPERERLLLIDHPKAPPDGSFGALAEPWLAGPLRSSLPLEVLIARLQELRPGSPIVVCGMTSALYGVSRLTAARVVWLPLSPLWRHNPSYRRRPLEFLHRSLRLARMAWLTAQDDPAADG